MTSSTRHGPPKTRERILEAAREVFAEKGLSGFTMTEVERRVGMAVGTGSIYRHFPSRGALLQAVMAAELRLHREAASKARTGGQQVGDPVEQRVRVYQQLLTDLHRFNRFFALMLENGNRMPELAEAIRGALEMRDSDGEAVDPYAMAALGGYHLFSIMQGGPFEGIERDEFLRNLAEMTSPRTSPGGARRRGKAGVAP